MGELKHIPVLLAETLSSLAVKPGGRYIDGTFGRGGHTREILRQGGEVLGIDRDDAALEAGERLRGERDERGPIGPRLKLAKGNHGDIARLAAEHGWDQADGILLDLGVSSPQLDEAARGFSFREDGPLDMRMDPTRGETAAELIARASADELTAIFRELGEEPKARHVAEAICRARDGEPRTIRFERTKDLADFIEARVGRRGPHHPATRVFQALRMAVNDEMGSLQRALAGGIGLLKPGGRFAVITFESLTDRTVKQFFAAHVGRMQSLQQGGETWVGELPRCKAVTRRAVVAGEDETNFNPRSRSAKLRTIERNED